MASQIGLQNYIKLLSRADSKRYSMAVGDPDVPTCPLLYVNPAFEALTGYRSEDILGRSCSFLQGEDTDQRIVGMLRAAVTDRQKTSVVVLNYRADMSPFLNLVLLTPVYLKNNRTFIVSFQSEMPAMGRQGATEDLLDHKWTGAEADGDLYKISEQAMLRSKVMRAIQVFKMAQDVADKVQVT